MTELIGWPAVPLLIMTFLLERTIAQRREGYAGYMRTTSAFIPLPAKDR